MLAARASEQIRGNGHLIKRLNKSRILECLQQGESLSRVELAERTGISVVGFDVGATKITGGIPDLEGNILATGTIPTHSPNSSSPNVAQRVKNL